MPEKNFILTPKWIVTVDNDNRVLRQHSLLVENDTIIAIEPTSDALERSPTTKHIELSEHILMPGLINAHCHASMNLLRGYADDLPLMDWLQNHIWPAEAKWVNEDFVADGSRLAIAEALLSGTTCINDMYLYPDVTAAVALEAGIRTCIGLIVLDFPTQWAKDSVEYLHKARQLHTKLSVEPLITMALAPHAPYTVSAETLQRISTMSHELGLQIHIHVHETRGEIEDYQQQHDKRPLQLLDELGLLNSSLMAVHMTQLSEQEIQRMSEVGAHVIHCPESNMKLASGACPVAKLLAAGINTAIGTDGAASNNDLDMFGEMRSAALLGKLTAEDASALPAHEVVRMATINGAKALNIANTIGSLEVGKTADMIAIDTGSVNMTPLYDPLSHLVYSCGKNDVSDVWVAGKQLVKHHKLQTIDQAAAIKAAQQWQQKISQQRTPTNTEAS